MDIAESLPKISGPKDLVVPAHIDFDLICEGQEPKWDYEEATRHTVSVYFSDLKSKSFSYKQWVLSKGKT